MPRTYKTCTRQNVATAYGFKKTETIMKRIEENIHRLDDEQLLQLGVWTGHGNLLPDQVEIVVFLLGKASVTNILYEEI